MATKTTVTPATPAMERRNTSHNEPKMKAGLDSFKNAIAKMPKNTFATVKQAVEELKAAGVNMKQMLGVVISQIELPAFVTKAIDEHSYSSKGTPPKTLVQILMGKSVDEVMLHTFYKTVKVGAGDKKAAKAAAATPAVKTPAPKVKAPVAKKAPVVAKKAPAPAPAPKAAPVAKKVTKK